MTLEALKVIIMACSLGASGMGGNYTFENTILTHHEKMVKNNLKIQRQCQNNLIKCVKKNSNKYESVSDCMLEDESLR